MVAERPPHSARSFSARCRSRPSSRGIAGYAAAQFGDRGGSHRRHPAEQACEIADFGAEIEQECRQRHSRPAGGAERAAESLDHAAKVTGCGCIRSHVTAFGPLEFASASYAMVAAMSSTAIGWNGVADSRRRQFDGNAASARSIALPP